MKSHYLYVLGGPAKVGKSTLTEEIKRGRFSGGFQWDYLQYPLIKNLFTTKVPENATMLAAKGTITTQPHGVDETKGFDKSFPFSVFVVPSAPQDSLIEFPTDYVRTTIRMAFLGGNYGLSSIAFNGTATYLDFNNKPISSERISISARGEDENAWNALVPLLVEYDQSNKNDILIEGVAIAPERIANLKLNNLVKKVAFIGYSDAEKYVQNRIDYAKRVKDAAPNNYDWPEIQQNGEEAHKQKLLKEAREQVPRNETLREEAKKFGFNYFDLTSKTFEEHIKAVMGSL